MSIVSTLKNFDFYPKSESALRTQTGAIVSIVAVLLAVLLFCAELRMFLTTEAVELMEVDDAPAGGSRNGAAVTSKNMRINFDVTFPNLPCAIVSLDVADSTGAHSENVIHNVFKRRLSTDGVPISDGERAGELGVIKSRDELLKEKQRAIAEGRPAAPAVAGTCGDCYGSADAGVCCNTCEEVREAYKRKGWQFVMKGVSQCESEGFYGDVTTQMDRAEGCNVYGSLLVPKVPGGFHFGPSFEMQQAYQSVTDMIGFTFGAFNVSHRVNVLSFGPYVPGGGKALAPLDGREAVLAQGTGMHQYFIKLVPLVYQPRFKPEVLSYQFSVTEHVRMLHKDQAALEAR
jgi:hypothetical protein